MNIPELPQDCTFGPFRLDCSNERLWRGKEAIPLKPKAFVVLRYLVGNPGRLVTKDEFFTTLWPDTIVSDDALKFCIRQIRLALGENPRTPQYIETIYRRGYRFIAPVSTAQPAIILETRTASLLACPLPIVGRNRELILLREWFTRALRGERQLVFVTGEPGIGKTTLTTAWLDQLNQTEVWVGRGQCIDHYGAGEAYLPVLEAVGRLCAEPGGEILINLLRQYAPTCLAQLPALLSTTEREALQRGVAGATQERMLREMAEVLETFTHERPVVLWLEDLHWSDPSTLELLTYLARRTGPARLLILGTYRPAELIVHDHPLQRVKQELAVHSYCQELQLEPLPESAVAEYIAGRFENSDTMRELSQLVYQRTEGNPLFMINVVNHLVSTQALVQQMGQWELACTLEEIELPTELQQFIGQQIAQVSPEERQVLEAAGVAGVEFSAAAVAAGIEGETVEAIEQYCTAIVHREQLLQPAGMSEWPDGTLSAQYRFTHALYRDVLYNQIVGSQRARLHRQIGQRQEAGYRERANEIAAELAVHFEQGRDIERAIIYRHYAGENAIQRSAYYEAQVHLTQGLALLTQLPNSTQRAQQELTLRSTLGVSLVALQGYTAPEVEANYTRVRALCHQSENPQTALCCPVWFGCLSPGSCQIPDSEGNGRATPGSGQNDARRRLTTMGTAVIRENSLLPGGLGSSSRAS